MKCNLSLSFPYKIVSNLKGLSFENGAAWLRMVRRGSVVFASACCKAGPSSILGSAPQGGFSHCAYIVSLFLHMCTNNCVHLIVKNLDITTL
jgi:hypothetical protein